MLKDTLTVKNGLTDIIKRLIMERCISIRKRKGEMEKRYIANIKEKVNRNVSMYIKKIKVFYLN